MILHKKDYQKAKNSIKSWLDLYPNEDRLTLGRRLVHTTQAPILIVYAFILELDGHNDALYNEFVSIANWYKDTVE